MSEMKRIDPKAVPEVFRRLGLKPIQGSYNAYGIARGEADCCVFTALAVDRVGLEAIGDDDTEIAAGYDNGDYSGGVVYGWDGEPVEASWSDEMRLGYADGRAAWLACVEAGLVEPTS
jgi:hypothetical protein